MRVAIIGRTRPLLETAERLLRHGHEIPIVWTCRAEDYNDAKEQDFEALSARIGATFRRDLGINSEAGLALLREARCDIAVSVNWLTVLSAQLLSIFPRGVLNAHAGDLPRYRGNACPNWAILAGEPHVGLCVHEMAEELDTGPVLLRDRYPLSDETYISDVYAWMHARIPELFVEAVDGLAKGTLEPTPQPEDPTLSLRTYPRRPDDGRIHWDQPVDAIHRLIRASSRPFGGAFAFLEGAERVTIWRAAPYPSRGPFLAVPGQVCLRADGDPVVACGDGMLRLVDVSLDGAADAHVARSQIARSLRTRLTSFSSR